MKQRNYSQALLKHHRLSDGLVSITNPLLEAYSLAQFCYFSVDSDGNSAALSTYPDWMEHYINQELFLFNPFLKSPEIIPEGVFLAKGLKDRKYLNSHKHAESFGIQDSLILTFKDRNKLVGFSLGLSSDLYENPLLIKEIPFLRNYCEFFLKEASKTICELESEPIQILPMMENQFHLPHPSFEPSANPKAKLYSLMKIPQASLSSREKECLRLYLEGETAGSIAEEFEISKRTVESYLENIKTKLDSYSKRDLLKKAKQLLDSGQLSPY